MRTLYRWSVHIFCFGALSGLMLSPAWADTKKDAKPAAVRWVTVRPLPVSPRPVVRSQVKAGKDVKNPHAGANMAQLREQMRRIRAQQRRRIQSPQMPNAKNQPLNRAMINSLINFYMSRVRQNKKDGLRLSREQQHRAHLLADLIITPCCYTQPVSVHGNDLAEAIKSALRWLVVRGYSDEQIKQAFVAAFGKRILSIPDQNIFLIPIIVSILAILFVIWLVRRWSKDHDASE